MASQTMGADGMGSPTPMRRITKIVSWMVAAPFLAVWPFLSALPVFGLINGGGSKTWMWLNIIFALAGFWPVFWLIFVGKMGATDTGAARIGQGPGFTLAWYALIWTSAYIAVSMLVK